MRITKQQLKQIIKEELEAVLEQEGRPHGGAVDIGQALAGFFQKYDVYPDTGMSVEGSGGGGQQYNMAILTWNGEKVATIYNNGNIDADVPPKDPQALRAYKALHANPKEARTITQRAAEKYGAAGKDPYGD